MDNRAFAEASRYGPQQQNANRIIPSKSKRSFHTTSSESVSYSELEDSKEHSSKVEQRKITPVFNDYGTAHSLITSGKAKNLSAQDRDQYRQTSSSSNSDSAQQLLLMNKRNAKLAADVVAPVGIHGSFSDNQNGGAYDDDERGGGDNQLRQTGEDGGKRMSPSPSTELHPKRPQTPLIPKVWDVRYASATKPPLAGGRLSAVQWPSTNPWNGYSPHARLSRQSSGILSPPDDGVRSQAYPALKHENSRDPYYSSPHGLPSPIISKNSGSSQEQRSSYYPQDEQQIKPFDEDLHRGDEYSQRNFVFEPVSRSKKQQYSTPIKSLPDRSEGSTVNHILDHYTHASGGSYYGDDSRAAIVQSHETPISSRKVRDPALGSAALTPSTEQDEGDADLSLRRFPNVPAPAYIRTASSGNVGSSSYGDSQELLGTNHQSDRGGVSSSHFLKPPRYSKIARGRRLPPSELGRQVSLALRPDDDEDSDVEVSSPVIKKPAPMKLRARAPIVASFQTCNSSHGEDSSDDGTVRRKHTQRFKENIPPSNEDANIREARATEDFRLVTVMNSDGSVVRKVSRRRGAVPVEDDQDDWETVMDVSESSPYVNLPFPRGGYMGYNQTGSSIADVSDPIGASSSNAGPFPSRRVLVHPARKNGQFDMHPRPLQDGPGSVMLPVSGANRYANGGFGSNAIRHPHKLMRNISHRLSSPLGSSSPRHEYLELEDMKKKDSSPFSPKRKRRPPPYHDPTTRNVRHQRDGRHLRVPHATWTDGPARVDYGSQESEENAGFRFGMNQRPERPDSYMQMIMAANGGKMPQFVQEESPVQGPRRQSQEGPDPYSEPYPEAPRIQYPPAIHSTTDSIANLSDTSSVADLEGPEYNTPPRRNDYYPYTHANAPFDSSRSSPQTESPYADRSRVSQKPLAAGGLYNSMRARYGSIRNKPRRPDLEAGFGPNMNSSPQSTKGLRPLRMRPSVVQPRSHHEFQYRSPLAPIKEPDWKLLYTEGALKKINEAQIGPDITPPVIAHLNTNGGRMASANSWRVQPESPHMFMHPHDDSSMGVFAERKHNISRNMLIAGMFFPPILALLALGGLDWLMKTYTKRDIRHFDKKSRNLACKILAGEVLLAILVIIAVVVYNASARM